jgi:hypothetical protein
VRTTRRETRRSSPPFEVAGKAQAVAKDSQHLGFISSRKLIANARSHHVAHAVEQAQPLAQPILRRLRSRMIHRRVFEIINRNFSRHLKAILRPAAVTEGSSYRPPATSMKVPVE